MAYWAMLMFFAALATFIITSIGTFLIWRQVKLTREAVEDTSEATAAMKEANEIARVGAEATKGALIVAERQANIAEDTAERQLRAYVVPEAAWLEISDAGDVTAHVHAKNYGQTPALNERHWVSIWVECYPLHDPLPRPENPQMGCAAVGPGGHTEMRHSRPNPLNEASKREIIAGKAAIYVFGEILYEDIYGTPRKSEYTYFCTLAGPFERGRLAAYREGNTCE